MSGLAPLDNSREETLTVLIYGASTATGTMILQLLRLSNIPTIATCSPHNFDLARSYGANTVIDYANPDAAAELKKRTNGGVERAIDTITDLESIACCYSSISRFGGKYTCLELCPENLRTRRAVTLRFPIAYEVFGKKIELVGGYERPSNTEPRTLGVGWFKIYQELLNKRKLKPHPVKILAPGFQSILDGLEVLKSGSISGKSSLSCLSEMGRSWLILIRRIEYTAHVKQSGNIIDVVNTSFPPGYCLDEFS
jgi:NADPH:quinone reductase-like Zn-dependent oxidoreductase